MERFTNLLVILAQGPCYSSLYRSSFSTCAAEASTPHFILNDYLSFLRQHSM